jgi:hypothetical protein
VARIEGDKLRAQIRIERITDADSDDLHDALALYRQRIPTLEQFEIPDIVRWIREDLEQVENGILVPRDFFLVAKLNDEVCGFILFHYYPEARFAFIAYLVAATGHSSPNYSREGVSKKLLAQVRTFMEGPLKDCEGILLEVDRPLAAATEQEMLERLARIRLFCMLAQAQGFSLRAFDMDYLQPPLSLENPDLNVPMLLMYVNPGARNAASYMKSSFVRKVLKFIYTDLYPQGYSDNETENRKYKACLRKFAAARLKTLPQRISMLDFKQLKARTVDMYDAPTDLEVSPLSAEPALTELDQKEVSANQNLSKRLTDFRTASKVGTVYILDWALLSVLIGAALGMGGLAMSEGKFALADVLYIVGVGLFIAKACYDHRNHELKRQLLLIFVVTGSVMLVGLLVWSEVNRRKKNQQATGGIAYPTPQRNTSTEISPSASPTAAQNSTSDNTR